MAENFRKISRTSGLVLDPDPALAILIRIKQSMKMNELMFFCDMKRCCDVKTDNTTD